MRIDAILKAMSRANGTVKAKAPSKKAKAPGGGKKWAELPITDKVSNLEAFPDGTPRIVLVKYKGYMAKDVFTIELGHKFNPNLDDFEAAKLGMAILHLDRRVQKLTMVR